MQPLQAKANTTKKEQKNTSTKEQGARGLKLAFIAYSILIILQLAAFFYTNILAMYAQALDRLSDVMVSGFLLVSFYWSRKPADRFHMFGHGRAQNVAAVVLAIVLIFFLSVEVFRESIPKLLTSQLTYIESPYIALIISAAGMLIIAIPAIDILRTKVKGASAKAQVFALLQDELSYAIGLVSIILVSLGILIADAIASTIIAVIIALGGLFLLRENVHYLIGRAPEQEFFDKLASTARSVEGVLGIHDLKAEYVGPNIIQASLHIEVAKGTSIETANNIATAVEARVSRVVNCDYCVVHMDPVD